MALGKWLSYMSMMMALLGLRTSASSFSASALLEMDMIHMGESEFDISTVTFRSFEQGSTDVLCGTLFWPSNRTTHSNRSRISLRMEYCCKPSYPPSRRDWEAHRELFTRLYQAEERPLKEVMEIMKDRYGFRAT